jgi:hypothetical protein
VLLNARCFNGECDAGITCMCITSLAISLNPMSSNDCQKLCCCMNDDKDVDVALASLLLLRVSSLRRCGNDGVGVVDDDVVCEVMGTVRSLSKNESGAMTLILQASNDKTAAVSSTFNAT